MNIRMSRMKNRFSRNYCITLSNQLSIQVLRIISILKASYQDIFNLSHSFIDIKVNESVIFYIIQYQ